jgi:ankyrin repeat protein
MSKSKPKSKLKSKPKRQRPPKADEPPLHKAARVGDHDAIKALVAGGEDVDALFNIQADPDCGAVLATPLMVAAGSGYGATVETLRLLLDLGADPWLNFGAGTAARFAVEGLTWGYEPGGDAERLEWLLAYGFNPDEMDDYGNTLLAGALRTLAGDRARVLLRAGASPDPPPMLRKTAKKTQQWQVEYYFQSPLFVAADAGDAETVRALLEAGACTTLIDKERRTALFHAQGADTVKALLEAGLELEARDRHRWTPLTNAVVRGDLQQARILLEAGADPNATHDRGFTVFMSAVSSMDRAPDMLRLLLEAGADPHATTELGWNAFHAAIDVNGAANREESVRSTLGLLASLGVDINHRANGGGTPLSRAGHCGTEIEVRVLLELGAKEHALQHS